MRLGNMRFVLEEDNALVLRNKDGIEFRREPNIIPEGHCLVLASEDLSYITYGPKGFSYKRYNPENLAIEPDGQYDIPISASQTEYENSLPLAAYCPMKKKAFFITISKTTREIRVYEKDNSEPRTVDEDLPKIARIPYRSGVSFKKDVSFHSSYFGEGTKKYTVFLSGEDHIGYWQFAIDIPKKKKYVQLLTLQDGSIKIKFDRQSAARPNLFGVGINPSSISRGRGGNVYISTPHDDDDIEFKSDSLIPYKLKYNLTMFITLFSSICVFAFLMANILFSVLPQLWIDKYVNFVNYLHTIDCVSCHPITHQDTIYLTTFILCFALLFAIAALPKRISRSIDLLMGNGINRYSMRADKSYDSKLRKFSDFLDCYQTSPSTIAILQKNKIQFYNFLTHQILEERNVQGNFDKYLFLKQRASFQTYHRGGREIEECISLILCKVNDGSVQFKICNLEELKVGPTNELSINPNSGASLKTVLIEYDPDAHKPIKLNTRVEIEHTSNPMLLTIELRDPNDGSIEFYNSLKDSTQVWSNITNISNLIDIVDDIPKGSDITFTLDNKRTRVVYGHGFDVFSQTDDWEKKAESDKKLRHIKGSTEIVPNLETAIFLADGINSPVSTFIRYFSKTFSGLLKDLWTCGLDSKIHQERQNFEIEDDLPALAYMVGELENFKGCNPKQNTALWEDWKEFLSPEQVNRIVQKIKKGVLHSKEGRPWPRKGFAHRMMHGDLTPTNVIVNSGNVVEVKEYYQPVGEWIESKENYNLLLCDFSDLVVLNEKDELIYRTEIVKNSEQTRTRVSSQFFDTTRVPKINPMLDLAKFVAHLWLKIPFEPSKRDMLNEEKYLLRNDARIIREKRDEALFHEELANELNKALDWAEKELKISCKLDEPGRTKESWRELLKAMIFDQCLQIIMFWKGYRSEAAWEITPTDLCWIFYSDDGGRPIFHSPTFLEKADNIMRREASGKEMVYLSAEENMSRNSRRVVADHVYPKSREQTKIHHPSGSFYEWAKNLLNVYNESHFIEHDVVETTDDENQLNSPFYRVVFTQTARDSLDKYTDKIYDPLEKWVSNKDLIDQSSKLDFDVWGQIQLYKSELGQSSRVFFAIYDYGDDVILHVIGFYVDDD